MFTYLLIYPQSSNKINEDNDILNYASPSIRIFTNKDGLPQSSIRTMCFDKEGRFWVGTQEGAAFYDGYFWHIVNIPDRNLSNDISIIYVSSDSSVWFGTGSNGFYRYKNKKWYSYYINDSLQNKNILSILEEKKGANIFIWVATNKGVYKYLLKDEKLVFVENKLSNLYVADICEISENVIWFATNLGIYSLNGNHFGIIKIPDLSLKKNILTIKKMPDGSIWIGGIGFLGKYDNYNWEIIKLKSNTFVYDIYEDRYKQIFIGTDSGLLKFKKKNYSSDYQIESVNLFSSIPNNRILVNAIIESIDGSLWIGSHLGLFRYNDKRWLNLTYKMKFEDGGTINIIQTKNGDYWFGKENGILQFSDGSWKSFDNITKGGILYIYQSMDSSIWISVFNEGVLKYKNGIWEKFNTQNGLLSNFVWNILQTKDGKLWFGCEGGIAVYHLGKWKTFTQKDGLIDNKFFSLYKTEDNILWIGTSKGIMQFYNNKFQVFKINNKSFNFGVLNFYEMKNSKFDNENILWIGTISNGIFQLNRKTNELINFNDTTKIPISNNSINAITSDNKGRLYISTNKGITRFILKNGNVISSEMFYSEDGLPNDEGIHGANALLDSKGRVWIGSTEGAAILDPNKEITDTSKKPLIITNILISNFDKNDLITNNIILKSNQNNLIFEYSLISFFKSHNSTYKIQLVGYDKSPSIWSIDRKKEYTNLYEGNYIFYVWGKDYAGNVSGPIKFYFTIQPPFWRTGWFYIIVVLFALSIGFVSIRFYISRKLKKNMAKIERQRMIDNERLRISKDMHDSVGSSLTRISILSNRVSNELENTTYIQDSFDEIKKRILSINDISRESIDSMNEVIWSINPKYDNLQSLISFIRNYFYNLFEETTIDYSMNVEGEILELKLEPDVRRDIFLIFKEALNNIIKHSNASIVKVNIIFKDNLLNVNISDNGVGFDESSLKKVKLSNGLGLSNIRHRAININATLNISSILDKGTTINFSINL
ncbi:MAG: hypothetical protein STSR0008_19290 [Ignavibacterium sp.]